MEGFSQPVISGWNCFIFHFVFILPISINLNPTTPQPLEIACSFICGPGFNSPVSVPKTHFEISPVHLEACLFTGRTPRFDPIPVSLILGEIAFVIIAFWIRKPSIATTQPIFELASVHFTIGAIKPTHSMPHSIHEIASIFPEHEGFQFDPPAIRDVIVEISIIVVSIESIEFSKPMAQTLFPLAHIISLSSRMEIKS